MYTSPLTSTAQHLLSPQGCLIKVKETKLTKLTKFPAPKQADKRKDLLTRIGTALHPCREHLSKPAEDPESDSEPDSETEPAELSEPDDDPSEDDHDYSEKCRVLHSIDLKNQ